MSQVLNLFMGGEDSPSKLQEDKSKTEKDNGRQLTGKAHGSPNRPPLLQKLNRMHGDSVILVWFQLQETHACSSPLPFQITVLHVIPVICMINFFMHKF